MFRIAMTLIYAYVRYVLWSALLLPISLIVAFHRRRELKREARASLKNYTWRNL